MDPARPVPHGFPTAHEALLLRAAVAAREAAATAWDEWSDGRRLEIASSRERALLPAVYTNLAGNGVDRPDMPRLRGIHRHQWTRERLQGATADRLIEALEPTPALRLGTQVLVPCELSLEALQRARAAGWSSDDVSQATHLWRLRAPTGEVAVLRRRALIYGRADEHELWTDGLTPAFELLVSCIDGLTARGGPRWILHARELRSAVDWDRFLYNAARQQLARPAAAALHCAERFGGPVPGGILEQLERVPEDALARALLGEPHGVRRGLVLHRVAYRALAPQMSFPAFLLHRLGLDSPHGVPAIAARRMAARYRARRRRNAALAIRV